MSGLGLLVRKGVVCFPVWLGTAWRCTLTPVRHVLTHDSRKTQRFSTRAVFLLNTNRLLSLFFLFWSIFRRIPRKTHTPKQVTASERAVSKEGASSMDDAPPRGSKRGPEDARAGEESSPERAPGSSGGESQATAASAKGDRREDTNAMDEEEEQERDEQGEVEGDKAAARGDLELCKRKEVRLRLDALLLPVSRGVIFRFSKVVGVVQQY